MTRSLGGGLKDSYFLALPGEMIQFETCVSNGLVQPPTRCVLSVVCNGDMVRNSDPSLSSQDLALKDSMSLGIHVY